MQVQIEEVSPIEKKLVVQVPWATVNTKLGASYRQLAKEVNLKGFRRGKVPRSVLEQMFSGRVHAEVAGEFVRESFMTALSEHKLEAVADPRVESSLEITKGQPLNFEAIVEVRGDVVVNDFKGMELTKRPLKLDEEDLEHKLSHLQKDHMDLLPIEDRNELATTDMVTISIKGKIGEEEVDRPELVLDLGDDHHEPLPGLHAALVGLPLDTQNHSITIEIPEDHKEEQIAGKTATFVVSVIEAKFMDLPTIDDEFAKENSEFETAEELLADFRNKASEQEREKIQVELNQAAVDELVKRNPIPVASSLTERVIGNRWVRLQRMMGMQPRPASEFPIPEEARAQLTEGAEDEVRGQLLLDALADKEDLKAGDDEVDARVAEIAARSKQTAGQLKAAMTRDGRLNDVVFQLKQDKAVALILEHATVTEKEKEPEEVTDSTASDD